MGIFHQSFLRNYLIQDYEIFDNFVFSLKVLQPLMATAGGMRALLTSCYILFILYFFRRFTVNQFVNPASSRITIMQKKTNEYL